MFKKRVRLEIDHPSSAEHGASAADYACGFPSVVVPPPGRPMPVLSASGVSMRVRMLLVEDNPAHGRLISETLRAAGFAVKEADSADAALQHLWDRDFDGVALDCRFLDTDSVARPKKGRRHHLDVLDGGCTKRAALQRAIFRNDGDYWTIAYRGKTRQLNDMKGFNCIAHLLRNEGRQFSAVEVLAAAEGRSDTPSQPIVDPETDRLSVVTDLGDAGEVIDDQAAEEYARRLHDLREQLADLHEQLEEATRLNDLGRHEEVRERSERVLHERDFIARQLAEAGRVGRGRKTGSRGHKAASHQERARQIVTKNIKAALEKIHSTAHFTLAYHLTTHIKTGYTCFYTRDPEHPIEWKF